jgi:hypothetical protein
MQERCDQGPMILLREGRGAPGKEGSGAPGRD